MFLQFWSECRVCHQSCTGLLPPSAVPLGWLEGAIQGEHVLQFCQVSYLSPLQAADSWFWIPWLLPHVGGVLGAGLYKVMVGCHHKEDV